MAFQYPHTQIHTSVYSCTGRNTYMAIQFGGESTLISAWLSARL